MRSLIILAGRANFARPLCAWPLAKWVARLTVAPGRVSLARSESDKRQADRGEVGAFLPRSERLKTILEPNSESAAMGARKCCFQFTIGNDCGLALLVEIKFISNFSHSSLLVRRLLFKIQN